MEELLYSIGQSGPVADVLLQSGKRSVTRAELLLGVEDLARRLERLNLQSVALYADNGIDWAISVAPDARIPVMHEELRKIKGADFEVVVAPSTQES